MSPAEALECWHEIVSCFVRFNLSTPHCITVLEDDVTGQWVDLDTYLSIWLYIPEDLAQSYSDLLGSDLYDRIHDGEMVNDVSLGKKVLLDIFAYDVEKMRNFIQENLITFIDAFKESEKDSLSNEMSTSQLEEHLESPRITNFINDYMTKGLYFINFINATLSPQTAYRIVHYGFSMDMREEYLEFKVREFTPF